MFGWLKRRRQGRRRWVQGNDPWPLDLPLMGLSRHDDLTLADCCQGISVLGVTGGGKTTGPGQALAKAFLQQGFGGLVLTAKPDEPALWRRYARETGREEALAIFGPGQAWRFNFMDYELRRPGVGSGHTENVVALFNTAAEVMERKDGGGQSRDPYWQRATSQLVRNAADVLAAAAEPVSFPTLHELVMSAPQSLEEAAVVKDKPVGYCGQCLHRGYAAPKSGRLEHDFKVAANY